MPRRPVLPRPVPPMSRCPMSPHRMSHSPVPHASPHGQTQSRPSRALGRSPPPALPRARPLGPAAPRPAALSWAAPWRRALDPGIHRPPAPGRVHPPSRYKRSLPAASQTPPARGVSAHSAPADTAPTAPPFRTADMAASQTPSLTAGSARSVPWHSATPPAAARWSPHTARASSWRRSSAPSPPARKARCCALHASGTARSPSPARGRDSRSCVPAPRTAETHWDRRDGCRSVAGRAQASRGRCRCSRVASCRRCRRHRRPGPRGALRPRGPG